jgi:MEMO1 family protein
MNKKYLLIIPIVGLILSAKVLLPKGAALLGMGKEVSNNQSVKMMYEPITAVGIEYGEAIRKSFLTVKPSAPLKETHVGITSHHLPTAISLITEFYATLRDTPGPKQTFVVVGPDHFERCQKKATTTKRPYRTPFGQLDTNEELINELVSAGIHYEDGCFDGEHSIGVQAMYLKFLYPESRIVPITLSSGTKDETVNAIVDVLAKHKDTITVIVSVDFSHYQHADKADRLDEFSGQQIQKMDGSQLTLEHMDSPQSIKLAIAFAKAVGETKPHLLKHLNSRDIIGLPENTTGYWNIVFTK